MVSLAVSTGGCGGSSGGGPFVPARQTIFVPNTGDPNSITEYLTTDNGDATPLATITGANTMFAFPRAVAIEPGGDILACNADGVIARFAPDADGNATPISTISGANTMLSNCAGIVVNKAGEIIAIGINPSLGIFKFAAGASGNVAPIATISGSNNPTVSM